MSSQPCYVHRNMRLEYLAASSLSCSVFLQEGNYILLLALWEPFKTCFVTGGSHISAAVVCLFRQQRQTRSAINTTGYLRRFVKEALVITVLRVQWTTCIMNESPCEVRAGHYGGRNVSSWYRFCYAFSILFKSLRYIYINLTFEQ